MFENSNAILQQNIQLSKENATLKSKLYELADIMKKIENLESTFKKSQETYTQALTETNQKVSELKSGQFYEIKHLQNQIKDLRDSNVDLIRLLTSNNDKVTLKETVKPPKPVKQKQYVNKLNTDNLSKYNDESQTNHAAQGLSYANITSSQVREAVNDAIHINSDTKNSETNNSDSNDTEINKNKNDENAEWR